MQTKERKTMEKRIGIYALLVMVIAGILLAKLAWIQLVDTESYQLQAQRNKTRQLAIDAGRGNIVTADGVVLATDQPTFQVTVQPQTLADLGDEGKMQVINELTNLLNDPEITAEVITEKVNANRYRMYEPVVIKKGLTIDLVSAIESRRDKLPGVTISTTPERIYPEGNFASHILGYLGEVSQEELDAQSAAEEAGETIENRYKMGDYIGKNGLEKTYDTVLRGKPGTVLVEVDANGHPISENISVAPEVGNNLLLTIDYDLQKTLEEAFDRVAASLQANPRSDKAGAGAAVLLDVKTGKVLAMTSRPDDKITQQNRAIQGRYIPGSTFKPVTAVSALETGNVTTKETIRNPGRYWEKPYIKSTAPAGVYNIYTAMAKSDNTFFQEIARRTGVDNIAKYGAELGLEGVTGIDLPYESSGNNPYQGALPTKEKRESYNERYREQWGAIYDERIDESNAAYDAQINAAQTEEEKEKLQKQKERAEKQLLREKESTLVNGTTWRAADTFNIGIGQGRQSYTPLQLAIYVSTIANGGTVYQPYIVDEIQDGEGNTIEKREPVVKHVADISQETLQIVRDAMSRVTAPGGTAYSLFMHFPSNIKVGAKTGTSQPGGAGYKVGSKEYFDGVFVAFAPVDDPQIAFACVMEYGYSGSGSGGIVCKAIFEKYFGLN